VQELLKVETLDQIALGKIMNLLTLVCNQVKYALEHREACAMRLCQLAVIHKATPGLEFDKKIQVLLGSILTTRRPTPNRACASPVDASVRRRQPGGARTRQDGPAELQARGVKALLDLLRNAANPGLIDIVIEIGNDKNGKNLVLRRDCIKWLGNWAAAPRISPNESRR